MKIERIELWHVSMPLKTPWKTAYGSDAAQESVIVKMTNSDGCALRDPNTAKPTS
jgi:O-succinylbenzoate synthase